MKLLPLALVAALATSALALPTAASARNWHKDRHHHGWNKGHHRHCSTTWHHHHRVRVCR